MKTRIELAQYFNQLGFKRGAEIGVADGRYSEILCESIPDATIYGVDPYRSYSGYSDYRREETFVEKYLQVRDKTIDFPNYVLIVTDSAHAAELFPDNSLDFVFIDANHAYDFVKQDINLWAPKVRPGGIVSGHDYYESRYGKVQVVKAVDEYVAEHGYKLQTTERDRSAHRDDVEPDWWFLK